MSDPLNIHMYFPVLCILVIANAASFHDIETDWKWLEKYLLETLGKWQMHVDKLSLHLLEIRCGEW